MRAHHRRMQVFGVDEQTDVAVALDRWVDLARNVLEDSDARPGAELTLLFVDEPTMADLNHQHMGADGATDVLAFPIDDDLLEPGRFPDNGSVGPDRPSLDHDDIPVLLGDVVVCPVVAARQAPEHAGTTHHTGSVDDEIALLVVHGVLHVLGMDHAEPEETQAMQAREQDLLSRFHRQP